MNHLNEFIWTERYRPRTVQDTILPQAQKKIFQQFVDQKNIPNLLLVGGPGTGKTTVAKAMLDELGCEYVVINGSLSGNIDTLRNDIRNFASTVSMLNTGRKYVILDEADGLNPQSFQPALRNFMEEYSKNCGFILTCNYRARILKELQSRCSVVEFKITGKERGVIATQVLKRLMTILTLEKIPYDKNALTAVVAKYFPDTRRILNELQSYSASGNIDTGILSNFTEDSVQKLFDLMKTKDFSNIRKWVGDHADIEPTELLDTIYTKATELVEPKSIPILVLILAKYSYQSAFVAHQEINTAACVAEIMMECTFKK